MIKPIHIYILKNSISFASKKIYVLYDIEPEDNRYCRFNCNNYTLYISPSLCKNYVLEHVGGAFTVSNTVLSNVKPIIFDEILDLIIKVDTSINWKALQISNILQLVIAKWDDWN